MRRPLPSQAFTRALDSLRRGAASITVLKDLLDLGAAPENIPQIATDSAIVPICMGLLQQHCARSSIFGENDYGVICIRLIALRVQINLLESTGCTFNDNDDMGYDGPTSNLRTTEYTLSNAIFTGYENRRPDDPPDLFRTSVGLVHAPPVLTADQAIRLLGYLHRERDLFLRARASVTSDWAGWPFLFHALWERLMSQNGNKTTRLALELLDICYCFLVVKPGGAVLLTHVMARIKSIISQEGTALPLPANSSDRDKIMKAYINVRLTNEESNAPSAVLTHSLFIWVVRTLDITRADQVVDFFTTSCDHLWVVLEDMKYYGQVACTHVGHGMSFATNLILHLQSVFIRCG
ncbi:hypothetical protein FRC09_010069 [Ceratobasidium sp. 395]|nr:hypothetical protein FRC09_010069 [Ceratobasidium sp. 395]